MLFNGTSSWDGFIKPFISLSASCGWTQEEKLFRLTNSLRDEASDKGLVQVVGVADISFCAGSHMYTWYVLIASIEEEGFLGMDFLFAHNADSLSTVPCDPTVYVL